jgi:hypothetical protein
MGNVFLGRRNQRRRHRRSRRRAIVRALVMLSSLVLVLGMSALFGLISDRRAVHIIEPPGQLPIEMAEPAQEPRSPARPVFRHSVIAGGAYSADEVEAAMGRDRVVATHYSTVNARELRVETLPEDRAAYMSYRVGDKIFWTKQKVRLKQGETILTDGVNHIRARCGNCIAFAPMEPTADDEPGEMEFDALTDHADVVQSRMPLGSDWLLQPIAGIPLPWLEGDFSDTFAPGGVMGGGPLGVPLFEYADDPTELELPGAAPEIVLFPLVDGEPPFDGFPPPGGPFTYPPPRDPHDPGDPGKPGDPSDPGDPGDPGDPYNPIFPPPKDPVVVPEPATLLLVGGGLATLVARRRRRR